jgi:hypothetical protein
VPPEAPQVHDAAVVEATDGHGGGFFDGDKDAKKAANFALNGALRHNLSVIHHIISKQLIKLRNFMPL